MNTEEVTKLTEEILEIQKNIYIQVWKHKKTGKEYFILKICFNEANCEMMVVYTPRESPTLAWVRPYNEFIEKFEVV